MKQNCNVPAFLNKLWTLVEDGSTDDLICWSQNGTCFQVSNERKFAKEILPLYFKHNNMASFIRQLNMYGFHKVVHVDVGLPREELIEFQHPHFSRGEPQLLENIKRKICCVMLKWTLILNFFPWRREFMVSVNRGDDVKQRQQEMTRILSDVCQVMGRQDLANDKFLTMKRQNEMLWKEVSALRQKHLQQHKIIRKVIHFIATMFQTNCVAGIKRKMPLMIGNSEISHSSPKYSRPVNMEANQDAFILHGLNCKCDRLEKSSVYSNGMIISDITHLLSDEQKVQSAGTESSRIDDSKKLEIPEPFLDGDMENLVSNAVPTATLPFTSEDFYETLLDENCSAGMEETFSDRSEIIDHLDLIDSNLAQVYSSLSSARLNCDSLKDLFNQSVGVQEPAVTNLSNTEADKRFSEIPPRQNVQEEHGYSIPQSDGKGKMELLHCCSSLEGPLYLKEEEEGSDCSEMLPSLLELAKEASSMTFYPSEVPIIDMDILNLAAPKSRPFCC
nr:PREDICTED: heat shock factor protein 1-like isoform X3 [Latimeria chalumnae]|eukprot:XP_006003813.1 PREDICTED: heat shock factor protein 1-like isoform X3 [Latimeria chalumnae]